MLQSSSTLFPMLRALHNFASLTQQVSVGDCALKWRPNCINGVAGGRGWASSEAFRETRWRRQWLFPETTTTKGKNPAAVALGPELGCFDKASHMCPGENVRLLVVVTSSLSGAVTSEVENLAPTIYSGKGKEERNVWFQLGLDRCST